VHGPSLPAGHQLLDEERVWDAAQRVNPGTNVIIFYNFSPKKASLFLNTAFFGLKNNRNICFEKIGNLQPKIGENCPK
jgi:hypothetical protein